MSVCVCVVCGHFPFLQLFLSQGRFVGDLLDSGQVSTDVSPLGSFEPPTAKGQLAIRLVLTGCICAFACVYLATFGPVQGPSSPICSDDVQEPHRA